MKQQEQLSCTKTKQKVQHSWKKLFSYGLCCGLEVNKPKRFVC